TLSLLSNGGGGILPRFLLRTTGRGLTPAFFYCGRNGHGPGLDPGLFLTVAEPAIFARPPLYRGPNATAPGQFLHPPPFVQLLVCGRDPLPGRSKNRLTGGEKR